MELIHQPDLRLFQTNYSRLQKLLNKEHGQEQVLKQQTGFNLVNN